MLVRLANPSLSTPNRYTLRVTAYRTPSEREKVPSDARAVITPEGHRTRAITLTNDGIARGGERTIAVRRMIRCKACVGSGCVACSEQGWRMRRTTRAVAVPAGATAGMVVTLEREGDTGASEQGDVLVRLMMDEESAHQVEKDDRALARRQKSWLRDRAKATRHMKRRGRVGLGVLAAFIAILCVLGLRKYLGKKSAGESCDRADDCRSTLCVESIGIPIGGGQTGMVTTKKCSQKCESGGDCPSGMACKDNVDVLDRLTSLPFSQARVCVPR